MKIIQIFFIIISVTTLFGSAYKGQRVYSKHCASCHGKQEYIQSKTAMQWRLALGADGEKLAKSHILSPKAKESISFFLSKKYKRDFKHLRDFLTEYAKDGKVPTCY